MPASHDYGLAADQVLEAQVVLANGDIVTANSCQFSDLYFAIRGGGGGTYGIVTSMTVKVYPSKPVVAQSLAITPLAKDTDSLLDAITDIYQQYPNIMDAGFSGYGSWSINSPMPNQTVTYMHVVAAMNKSLVQSQKDFDELFQRLQKYNGSSLRILVEWYGFSLTNLTNTPVSIPPGGPPTLSALWPDLGLIIHQLKLSKTISLILREGL